jgi:coenzyme F420-reducing hydrogenase alpha subunit
MSRQVTIDVRHLTRVEGHGNILVRIKDGKLEEARWDVVETPRFFEVMFKGEDFRSVPLLAARICGICSISHCLTTLVATENAFQLAIPKTAAKVRLLAKHGETLQSHLLHLFFLAIPDFLGLPSALPLLETNPEVVEIAVRLKGLANRLSEAAAGRTTHPVSLRVGGVSVMPRSDDLLTLRGELEHSLDDLAATVDLVKSFEFPDFARETEFVSLKAEDGYPFIGNRIISTDGVECDVADYLEVTNEVVDANNTSKWTRLSRDSYAVGALARFNNNHAFLHPEATRVARELKLEPDCHNPFMCNVAQLVECIHCTHEAMQLIDELISTPAGEIATPVEPKVGQGVGAVEAPRGILFHDYEYDQDGRIVRANCVVPTTQNNANIHRDLASLVAHFVKQGISDEALELMCSMLVRSYDPCISCSVH